MNVFLVRLRGRYLPPLLNSASILVRLLPRSSFSMKKMHSITKSNNLPSRAALGTFKISVLEAKSHSYRGVVSLTRCAHKGNYAPVSRTLTVCFAFGSHMLRVQRQGTPLEKPPRAVNDIAGLLPYTGRFDKASGTRRLALSAR